MGSAVVARAAGGVEVVRPGDTLASRARVVGTSQRRASLSARLVPPGSLTFDLRQQSPMWNFAVAVPPGNDVSDPPVDRNGHCISQCL